MSDQNGNSGNGDSEQFPMKFTREEVFNLDRLGSACGLNSRKRVVMTALEILGWLVRNAAYQRTVVSATDPTTGKNEVLENPALRHAAEAYSFEDFTTDEIEKILSEGVVDTHEMLDRIG